MPHTSQKIDEKLAWRCAHHEAGHAVVHLNLGDEIWRVTIDEPDNRGGRVWSSYPQSFNRGSIDMRTIADMRIIACVTGIAAELVLLGSPSSMEFYVSDLKRAHDRIRLVSMFRRDRESDTTVSRYIAKAVALLETEPFRSQVSDIANELVIHRTISGQRAHEIYHGALNSYFSSLFAVSGP
jgi:hypothetical protein